MFFLDSWGSAMERKFSGPPRVGPYVSLGFIIRALVIGFLLFAREVNTRDILLSDALPRIGWLLFTSYLIITPIFIFIESFLETAIKGVYKSILKSMSSRTKG